MENHFNFPKSFEHKVENFIIPTSIKKLGIVSDVHVPYHSTDSCNIAFSFLKAKKTDGLLLNGDIIDFHRFSPFVIDPDSVDVVSELDMLRQFLTEIRKVFKNIPIFYKIGNHENRLQRYLKIKAPELFGLPYFDYSNFLGLDKLNIKVIGDMQMILHGKLAILHGHEIKANSGGVNPARSLYMKFKESSVIGHLHRTSEHSEKTGKGKVISTWSLGCLCELQPAYASYNNWNHGFGINEIIDNGGSYEFTNYKIIKGKVV